MRSAQDWEQAISTGDWFDSGVVAGQSSRWDSAEQAWESRKSHHGAPPEYAMEARQQFIRGFDVGRGKVYRNPDSEEETARDAYRFARWLASQPEFQERYGFEAERARTLVMGRGVTLTVGVRGGGSYNFHIKPGGEVTSSGVPEVNYKNIYELMVGKRNPKPSYLDIYTMGVGAGERYKSEGHGPPPEGKILSLWTEAGEPGSDIKFPGNVDGFAAFGEGFLEGYLTKGYVTGKYGRRNPTPLAKRKRFQSHYQDFRKAGYNAQQAKDMAAAERWALDNDVAFDWEQDDITNRDFTDEGEEYSPWRVAARHPDGETAALGGVDFGEGKDPWSNRETDIYKRATEAELSMELMAALGHTGKRNPASSSSLQRRLEDEAFEGGKVWGESGSWASGVSNANVRRYGFVKWWNNTLTPAEERGVRKSTVERAFYEGYKIGREKANQGFRERAKGKRNPESSAADLYESFHGKPSEEVLEYGEEIHYHENLAGLGVLTEIKVDCFSGYSAVLKFDRETQLCSNEEGTQLYIIGGDQSLNLGSLKFKDDEVDKDQVAIGVITEITYNTQKGFHNFKPTDYYHELGEESGYQPILTYDTRNQQLTIAGGAYRIKPEGIVN